MKDDDKFADKDLYGVQLIETMFTYNLQEYQKTKTELKFMNLAFFVLKFFSNQYDNWGTDKSVKDVVRRIKQKELVFKDLIIIVQSYMLELLQKSSINKHNRNLLKFLITFKNLLEKEAIDNPVFI
jgi:hypothetical protein